MSLDVMKRALAAIEQSGGGDTRYARIIADLKREIHEVESARKTPIQEAVDRFLSWELPSNFKPDCYISFNHPGGSASWPTGTNLLNAEQAKWMLEYVLQER